MKLTIKLEQIHYGDIASKVMPLLRNQFEQSNHAAAKTVTAISELPDPLIHQVFEAIPAEKKNEIIAAFAAEYKQKVLETINRKCEENRIGVTLSDYTMDRELVLSATAGCIDYLCLVDRFLPLVREKLLGAGKMGSLLQPIIARASADKICEMLDRFAGSNKDVFLASLINQNQHRLIAAIEDTARKQGIRLKIASVFAEA